MAEELLKIFTKSVGVKLELQLLRAHASLGLWAVCLNYVPATLAEESAGLRRTASPRDPASVNLEPGLE